MKNEEIEIKHSRKKMASYGFGSLNREFLMMAFNTYVFFYYESEVGLNVWLIGIAYTIFAIYNALNDPIIGYLTNRPFKFTKKWGRRFPWILMGAFPFGLSYFLIFTPPSVVLGEWLVFTWLVATTFLFDTCHTLFFVNFQSLFPDKFRSVTERRTATAIQIPLSVVGVALGAMIPPLLITFRDLQSYVVQGVVIFIIALVTLLFAIPGVREDRELIDRYLASQDEGTKRESFFKTMILALKQRSFVAFMVLYTMYQVVVVSMTGSIPYVVQYILKMPASATTLLMASFLIGIILSTPLWVKLAQKTNDNRKVILISGFLLAAFTSPLIFLENYTLMFIALVLWGVSLGGFWCMIFPVMSDIIDEAVVRHKKREEGTYTGIQQFFARFAIIIQAISFAAAHELTGFDETKAIQSTLAIWGIHVHLALVPVLCVFFGSLVFWKCYDIKPDKVKEHQLMIRQLKL